MWCIHMTKRLDRLTCVQALQSSFPKLKVYNPVHSVDGQRGCYESHQEVMRQALDEHCDTAVIFEDDAIKSSEIYNHNKYIESSIRTLITNDVDIIYLGCFPDIWKHYHNHFDHSLYTVKATQTHAYIVHKRFMRNFILQPYDGIPIDEYYLNNARCLAWLPGLYEQENSPSNVSTKSSLSLFPYKNYAVHAAQLYALNVGIPLYFVCVSLFFTVALLIKIKYGRSETR